MDFFKKTLTIQTHSRGFFDFTYLVNNQIKEWGVREGMAFLFVQHTSASLVINENYAEAAQRDMEVFLDHLAPDGQSWHTHTLEGADDSPAHMRTMITHTSLSIPVDDGKLNLGTWQGIFLAEHRRRAHQRQVLLRVLAVN